MLCTHVTSADVIAFLIQFKDFLSTYNNVTENCFNECVNDFTARRVTKQEVSVYVCAPLCLCVVLQFMTVLLCSPHVYRPIAVCIVLINM